MHPRSIVASYLIVQAVGTAAWWAMLLLAPASVDWFKPSGFSAEALLAFWLGDFVLLIAGSLATAWACQRQRSWASIAVWALAAAVWYPALYCVGVSILTDEAWLASAMMVGMAGLTLAMATIHGNAKQQPSTIRVTSMTKTAAIMWTFAQTAIFWSVFLWILPQGIVEVEQRLGWPSFSHAHQSVAAITLFAAASLLGLLSGMTMASCGDGTPLPTATAPQLVIVGPYRFVRNPMAVAGILQGIAVGWWMGSYTVIAYSIAGAFVWHWFVRPVEEADLLARFGDNYVRYKHSVRLWVPAFGSAMSRATHYEIE